MCMYCEMIIQDLRCISPTLSPLWAKAAITISRDRRISRSGSFALKREITHMKKYTVQYVRYALALLANVGFRLASN